MSAAAKISVVTGGPLCRNPRALKEARTLGAAGYDVTVFTIAHRALYEQIDAELIAQAPFRKISLPILSETGSSTVRSVVERSATWFARRVVRYGIQSDRAFGPADALTRAVRRHPADLTIVHTELGLAIGRRLARKGRRVAADFEDWHSRDLLAQARKHRPQRLLEQLEREMLHNGPFTFTTSEALAEALTATYGGHRPEVVRNTFPLQPLASRPLGQPPAFFWFSQTLGPGRGLGEFVTAWSLMTAPARLCLLGEPVPDYRDALTRLVAPSRRGRLEFLNVVSPAELPSLIATHDVGLALEPTQPASRNLTVTNKVFQYFNGGLAVLATNTDGQREIAQQADRGVTLIDTSDPHALARLLDELVRNPVRLDAMRTASRRAAEQRFCWEKEEPKLLDAVSRTLGHAARLKDR